MKFGNRYDHFWHEWSKYMESDDYFNVFKPMDSKIVKTKDKVVVSVDMPGFTKEQISVEVLAGYLTISGKNDTRKVDRRFALDDGYLVDNIEAKLDLGVLTVTIPFNTPGSLAKKVVVQ